MPGPSSHPPIIYCNTACQKVAFKDHKSLCKISRIEVMRNLANRQAWWFPGGEAAELIRRHPFLGRGCVVIRD